MSSCGSLTSASGAACAASAASAAGGFLLLLLAQAVLQQFLLVFFEFLRSAMLAFEAHGLYVYVHIAHVQPAHGLDGLF